MTQPAASEAAPTTSESPHQDAGDAIMSASTSASSTKSLPEPEISIQVHGDSGDDPRPLPLPAHLSAPAVQQYKSPMRQHRRTPSHHREVKETLNARTEYTSDDSDGRSHHKINQYTIKEEIGRGSYGAVHLAVDQYGQEYAVKEFSKARLRKRAQSNILRHGPRRPGRFPPRGGMDPSVSDRLSDQKAGEERDALFLIREEIAIMKKINHPNLVSLIEVLDDPEEDSLYMVLEMCKKGVVMKVGLGEPADPYGEEACRCWFRDLILGIEYLHAQGVVHRDIKPDNLLLTDEDVLKVVDFGVSEMFEKPDQMRTAKSAGSPAFLPPELCVARHGDVSGKAADIWSMGVSLYCLRYGRIPFETDGVLEMYDAIKTRDIQLPENEDEDFVDLLHKVLEKDPEKRIKMSELRAHPWVTKRGEDPLLSEEDNMSDMVEPPNALEVNHAFTRRMSHLLCVMKAIAKFKGLIVAKHPELNSHNTREDSDPTPTQASALEKNKEALEKANAEHAAELLDQRRRILRRATDGSLGGAGKGHAHQVTDMEPLFLGIGTGERDDFAKHETPAEIVSDSPTAVEYDVYDRAYGAEVERIRSQSHSATMYLTRFLNETDRYKSDDHIIIEEQRQPTPLSKEQDEGGGGKAAGGAFKGFKFADLVAETIKDTWSKSQSESTPTPRSKTP